MNEWPEQFIPAEIVDSMVLVDDVEGDAAERGSYNDDISPEIEFAEEEGAGDIGEEIFSTSGLAMFLLE